MKTSAFVEPSAPTDCATLFVALELSKSKWLVGMYRSGSDKMSEYSIEAGKAGALGELITLIDAARRRAQKALGKPVRVVSCFEAGFDGFWLHWALLGCGMENRVLDPSSIPVPQKRRRKKTDRLDLKTLLRVLMALERGEERVCQVVHAPTAVQEDERRLSRERNQLVKERGQHTNRIGSLLMIVGIRDFQPCRKDWEKRLDALRCWNGEPLSPRLRAQIVRECERLHQVMEQIAEVEAEMRAAIKAPAPEDAAADRIQTMCLLSGLGVNSSCGLVREVFFRDFKNQRQVGGYFGLGGSPWQSGSVDRDQGISKAGNPRARKLAIQIAWLWLMHQPGSALTRWFKAKVEGAKGRLRRIAIVALARKLMVALWRYVTTGVIPEGATLKA